MAPRKGGLRLVLRVDPESTLGRAVQTAAGERLFQSAVQLERARPWQPFALSLLAHAALIPLFYLVTLQLQPFPLSAHFPEPPRPPRERTRLVWIPTGPTSPPRPSGGGGGGGDTKAPPAPRSGGNAAPAGASGQAAPAAEAAAPAPSEAAAAEPKPARRPPRFQTPEQAVKPGVQQTVLQPDLPPDLPPDLAVRLPNVVIPQAERPDIAKPRPDRFVMPQPSRPSEAPAETTLASGLDLPTVDAGETPPELPSELSRLTPVAPPRPTERFRLPKSPSQPAPSKQVAGTPNADVVPLIAASDRPAPLLPFIAVPEIHQAAPPRPASGPGGEGEGSGGARGGVEGAGSRAAGSDGAGEGASDGSGAGEGDQLAGAGRGVGRGAGAGEGAGSAYGPGADGGPGVGEGVGSGAGPGSGSGDGSGSGSGSGAGGGPGAGDYAGISVFGGEPGPDGGRPELPAQPQPIHMLHPETGDFDVVVVQSGVGGAIPGSEGVIQGRPVYTVYIAVGAPKEWILQYAVAGESGGGNAQVVSLESPAPVNAPYPIETLIPTTLQQRRRGFLLIHGTLDREGRWSGLSVVGGDPPDFKEETLPALEQWRFRPATRDGVPVAVEILLAIPPALA